MAKPKASKRDDKLDRLVSDAVAARTEYFSRKAAFDKLRPFLKDAIRKSDEADNALQDYLNAISGGSSDLYLEEAE